MSYRWWDFWCGSRSRATGWVHSMLGFVPFLFGVSTLVSPSNRCVHLPALPPPPPPALPPWTAPCSLSGALPSEPRAHQQSSWCCWSPEPELPGGRRTSSAPARPPPPSFNRPYTSSKPGCSKPTREQNGNPTRSSGTAFPEGEANLCLRKVCELQWAGSFWNFIPDVAPHLSPPPSFISFLLTPHRLQQIPLNLFDQWFKTRIQ